ncbi:probable glucan endo-1,3-beta-glucosidase A6 [Ziziphus jujuba]|uniref:glucan endo-1,3-beta-D-glucosidase n=1 Tax=Ziziphus jujuba TaxID=326968 RepID=A0ABM3IR90_ZIZJJ|nr:probable glucan endo-1,3-beta-glucosidase A6 [Ziziphus jujuba]
MHPKKFPFKTIPIPTSTNKIAPKPFMGHFAFFLMMSLLGHSCAEISSKIGLNYGQLGNNLPSISHSIELIKSMNAGRVKLYDANPEVLRLLSGTKIQVSIMVPNHEISGIASSQTIADEWVIKNVVPYYPQTMIRFLLVGNEVLSYFSDEDRRVWYDLVPAMRRIRISLRTQNMRDIKVGTPLAMDVLESTFPPSSGTFRSEISHSVMVPMLQFLNSTRSSFFIDAYTYFPWSANPMNVSLDFALLKENLHETDPETGLIYTNLLDEMLDSLIFAMTKLGFPNIRILVSETGWPNSGDVEEPGANIFNAATYNRNLIKKMTANPPVGTPFRPGVVIPAFIFALFDENQKTGKGTERHWGLLHANGTPIYEIDLTGKTPASEFKPLPEGKNNAPYRGRVWCVAVNGSGLSELRSAMEYACGAGNGICDEIEPGRECSEPGSVTWHASYAFSSYWAKFRSQGATCYFNGLAQQSTKDPSHGSCKFLSVTL